MGSNGLAGAATPCPPPRASGQASQAAGAGSSGPDSASSGAVNAVRSAGLTSPPARLSSAEGAYRRYRRRRRHPWERQASSGFRSARRPAVKIPRRPNRARRPIPSGNGADIPEHEADLRHFFENVIDSFRLFGDGDLTSRVDAVMANPLVRAFATQHGAPGLGALDDTRIGGSLSVEAASAALATHPERYTLAALMSRRERAELAHPPQRPFLLSAPTFLLQKQKLGFPVPPLELASPKDTAEFSLLQGDIGDRQQEEKGTDKKDKKADLAHRLEEGSQNKNLTPTEAYNLLEEYNRLLGKDHTVVGVADMSAYHGEKGKLVGYAGSGRIDVDGRSAVGRKGFKKSSAKVRAELEKQEKTKAKAENRKPKHVSDAVVAAATIKLLESQGRYYDPASQPEVAAYRLADSEGKATVVPDAAKLPYSSVPAAAPILNLIPRGAVVFVKNADKIALTIRIDAGGQHLGEISRAAAARVGIPDLSPIKGGISDKSLAYLAVPSVHIESGSLSATSETPEGLEAVAMPKIRDFLHQLSQEIDGAGKK